MGAEVADADVALSAICVELTWRHTKAGVQVKDDTDTEVRTSGYFACFYRAVAFWHGTLAVHLCTAVCVDLARVTDDGLAPCP